MTAAPTMQPDPALARAGSGNRWRLAAAPRAQLRLLLGLMWAASVFVITIPTAVEPVGTSLDESWVMGLIIGAHAHRQWGSQVIFTYGPLGYLDFPKFVFFDTWLSSILVKLAIHVVFVGALVLLMVKRRAGFRWWVLFGLLVVLPLYALPSLEHECLLATFVLLIVRATP